MKFFEEYDVEPIRDVVVVKRDFQGETMESGLYVPDSARGEKTTATVLAVGPGALSQTGVRIPPQVKVGDRVVLDTIAGIKQELDGEEVTVLREPEILFIVREK